MTCFIYQTNVKRWVETIKQLFWSFNQSMHSVKRVESLSRTTTFSTKETNSFTETVLRWQELRCFSIRIYRLCSGRLCSLLLPHYCTVESAPTYYSRNKNQSTPPSFGFFLPSPTLTLIISFTCSLFYLPASQSCQCFQPPAHLFSVLSILHCDYIVSIFSQPFLFFVTQQQRLGHKA